MFPDNTENAAKDAAGLARNGLENAASDTKEKVEKGFDKLQDNFEDGINKTDKEIHKVEANYDKTHDDLTHLASDYGAKVRKVFDNASDETTTISKNIENEIKTNPIRSTLIALGAGFIIGALSNRPTAKRY